MMSFSSIHGDVSTSRAAMAGAVKSPSEDQKATDIAVHVLDLAGNVRTATLKIDLSPGRLPPHVKTFDALNRSEVLDVLYN
jgi:hypothetical protein